MVKVPVWAVAIIDMTGVVEALVIDVVVVNGGIIEVAVVVVVLKFTLSVSYSVDVPADMTVERFMDVLTDVNANAIAVPASTPLEEFSL